MSRESTAAHPTGATRPALHGASGRRISPGLLALGYLVFVLAGMLTAAIEVLLVPSRLGVTLVPIAPVLAVLSNIALPAISRGLTDTRLSAAPPVVGWIVTAVLLASSTPEGDVLLPAGGESYISYSLLVLGLLTGVIMVLISNGPLAWTGAWLRDRVLKPRARSGSDSDDAR
jgi:hypothetical protein